MELSKCKDISATIFGMICGYHHFPSWKNWWSWKAASIPQIHLILYSVQSLVFPNLPPQKKTTKLTSKWSKKINPSPNSSSIFPTPFPKLVSHWIPLKILKKPNCYPLTIPTHPHPSPPPHQGVWNITATHGVRRRSTSCSFSATKFHCAEDEGSVGA